MKRIIGPVMGTLISTSEGSKLAYAAGEVGVLTVHESERKHPGKAFATLYYTAGIDPRPLVPGGFETESFIRTGCGDFEWRPQNEFSISGGGVEYRFMVLDGCEPPTSLVAGPVDPSATR